MVDFKLLSLFNALEKVARSPDERERLKAVARHAVQSPDFGERAAARVVINRVLGRSMPSSPGDRQHALAIMEWAHAAPDAEAAAPETVAGYRIFCKSFWSDEAHWRTAFDLALDIWVSARAIHLERQAAF